MFAGTDDGAPRQEPPAAPAPSQKPAQETTQPAARTESTPANDACSAASELRRSARRARWLCCHCRQGAAGFPLEIVNKGQVIAKTPVESSGDFAAVLDNPLPPGDHELVLRATGKNGKVSQSQEVATVSVPAQKGAIFSPWSHAWQSEPRFDHAGNRSSRASAAGHRQCPSARHQCAGRYRTGNCIGARDRRGVRWIEDLYRRLCASRNHDTCSGGRGARWRHQDRSFRQLRHRRRYPALHRQSRYYSGSTRRIWQGDRAGTRALLAS